MIQRIQSIYLLAVSVLMLFLLVLPIAEIAVERKEAINEKETADAKEIVNSIKKDRILTSSIFLFINSASIF